MLLDTEKICCPYCGERIELLVDASAGNQTYVEDCSVCCRPIVIAISVCDGDLQLQAFTEDDA